MHVRKVIGFKKESKRVGNKFPFNFMKRVGRQENAFIMLLIIQCRRKKFQRILSLAFSLNIMKNGPWKKMQ